MKRRIGLNRLSSHSNFRSVTFRRRAALTNGNGMMIIQLLVFELLTDTIFPCGQLYRTQRGLCNYTDSQFFILFPYFFSLSFVLVRHHGGVYERAKCCNCRYGKIAVGAIQFNAMTCTLYAICVCAPCVYGQSISFWPRIPTSYEYAMLCRILITPSSHEYRREFENTIFCRSTINSGERCPFIRVSMDLHGSLSA